MNALECSYTSLPASFDVFFVTLFVCLFFLFCYFVFVC